MSNWLRELWRRLRFFIHRQQFERDLDEEMRLHNELRQEEFRDLGIDQDSARYKTQRRFGNATLLKEVSRDMWGWQALEMLLQDIRYGTRVLRKSSGFTLVAVLSLALGIGANTAVFSFIDAVLLRTLPVREPNALVIVRALTRQGTRDAFSHTDYKWLNEHNSVFAGLVASSMRDFKQDRPDRKEKISGEFVSGNYYSVLGVQPILGRAIAPDDDTAPGRHPVVVISYAYWQRAFGGNPEVLGQELRFGDTALQVIGVAPNGFAGESIADFPDFWVPLAMAPALSGGNYFLHTRNVSWLSVMGRLRPGVTIRQARSSLSVLLKGMQAALHIDPQNDYLGSIAVEPGTGGFSGLRDQYSQPLWILMALVALVLAIACANVANLLLARSAARRREFAVRLAIGAQQGRLVRQLLTEACLLAVLACALGLTIAHMMVRGLLAIAQVNSLDVHLNLKVLVFAGAVSCAAALVFGVAPALQGRRLDPWSTLKLDRRSAGGTIGRFTSSRLLVTAQTALSLILLIAAGLMLRTFLNLKTLNPGFDQQRVLQVNVDGSAVAETGLAGRAVAKRLLERLSLVQGVISASFSGFGFHAGSNRNCCADVEGYTPHQNEDKNVRMQWVSPRYFSTMGIAFVAGRDFSDADKENSQDVAIINETMAGYYFGRANALGKRFGWSPTDPKLTEIIGVVRDAKYDNLRQQTPRMIYQSFLQHGIENGSAPDFLQVRISPNTTRPLFAIIADCRAAINAEKPRVPILAIDPLSVVVDRTLHPERLVTQLSAGFGIIALLLTSLGLYGILAYTVARRTSEFGIRMALGAERATILRMIMREGLALVLIGLVIGLVAAYSLSRLMANLLYGVQPHDVVTFSVAAFTLILVAIVASYGPAHRATRVDPMDALRYE